MDDLLSEFLTETNESMERLDVELVRLEQEPNDRDLLSGIFRLVHTIKGTCGFLGLPRLESVAHAAENILGRFRDGELEVTPAAVTLIFDALDRIKSLLAALADTESEPQGDDSDLIARLNAMAEGGPPPRPSPDTGEGADPLDAAQQDFPSPVGGGEHDFLAAAQQNIPSPAGGGGSGRGAAPLIERAGGIAAVDAAVEALFRRIHGDAELAAIFDRTEQVLLHGREVEFLSAALGGPDNHADADLVAAFRPALDHGLGPEHFERLAAWMGEALVELEVPDDAAAAVIAALARQRDLLLAAAPEVPAAAAPAAATAKAGDAAAGAAAAQRKDAATVQSVRVHVELLENLMTMVSELVLSRNQLLQMVRRFEDSEFAAPLQRLSLITTDLQEGVMKTRMQAIGNAWSKLPRIVRDLSLELGKKIELEMTGADTELDRQVLEMIKDPLTHMVRNSGDHGIEMPDERAAAGKPETGRIVLNAYHEGGHIIIEIADDGRGINIERVKAKAVANGLATEAALAEMSDQQVAQFVFKPGFSTAEKVTNVSGRGVGMDVVRTNIEKIGGHVELRSEPGRGSTFVVKIPLTLAIVSALIVECGGERFAIPQIGVNELVRVSAESEHRIEKINDTPVLRLRDRLLPLVALDEMLGLHPARDPDAVAPDTGPDETFIVVARVGTSSFGIVVDRVFESEEIVVKPVTPVLRDISIFSGNTILGDGNVIMILDPNGIAAAMGEAMVSEGATADEAAVRAEERAAAERMAILVFRAGGAEPKAVPLALVARLEEIDVGAIETVDGRLVVQYRGQLMPLVAVDGAFERAREGRQHVIVFTDVDHSMGLMVDEIVDIVEDRLNMELASDKTGVLGSAVVAGRAMEIVDIACYLERAFGDWFRRNGADDRPDAMRRARRVLLVDDSPFFRNLLTPLLSAAGYEVTAVEGGPSALDLREKGSDFDVIISDIEMPGMDGFELARQIRSTGAWQDTPLLALSSFSSRAELERGREAGFADYVVKLDREALLTSLNQTLTSLRGAA